MAAMRLPRRWASSRAHVPRVSAEPREREAVKPLEFYFDLVFVLGFTQCTALMAARSSWEGIVQGMLVLALLWWAWAGYAWLTSVIDPEEGAVRLVMFSAMAALLVVALCVPEAFEDRGLAFALAYGVVRAAHVVLFLIASRTDPGLRRLEHTLAHVDESLDGPHALALLGRIAVYLLAHVGLRPRNAHTVNVQRLGLALVLLALVPAALHVPALATLAGVTAALWALVAYETAMYDERRHRLRHGLDPDDPPG